MLHAVSKKKTRYHHRYLGWRDEGEKRVSEEDEITSTIFGPIDFMETASILYFWQEVFIMQGCSLLLPAGHPTHHHFELWRRGSGVEPDGHLTFFWPDQLRVDILIEIKWRSPLSGKDQLCKQWQNYLNKEERKSAWHVFIAPDISEGIAVKNAEGGNIWKIGQDDRLVLISWAQIRDAMFNCQSRQDGLARWVVVSSRFLEKIGICRFKGFAQTHLKLPELENPHGGFFVGRFKGFGRVGLDVAINNSRKSFFKSFYKR